MERRGAASALLAMASAGAAVCPPPQPVPPAPQYATDLNGVAWPDLCFNDSMPEEHFFVIGDWGGVLYSPTTPPRPADQTGSLRRPFVWGVDDQAQALVAAQMKIRANVTQPRFVLNAGDNFYWGGIETDCGSNGTEVTRTGQWQYVFEAIYSGPDLAGKPWMGVLGNHDYGGYMFTMGWDQAVKYTWSTSDRWLTPALYWSRKLFYTNFTVDMFFLDTNFNDAHNPHHNPSNNMCSLRHNPENASCAVTGPTSVWNCESWFRSLWEEQVPWLEAGLNASRADWQVVVTHFPPDFQADFWARQTRTYGIDLIVAGHRHQQEVHYNDGFAGGKFDGTAWIVSGGGGGITSEGTPRADGEDDMYGFMDVAISKDELRIDAISHGGKLRSSTRVQPRLSLLQLMTTTSTTTTTTQTSTSTSTTTTTSTTSATQASGLFLEGGARRPALRPLAAAAVAAALAAGFAGR